MANEGVFRSSLGCLAVILVLVGLYTHSFKKMSATYIFAMLAIGGVILPDWRFFDRSVSQWCNPLVVDDQQYSSRSAPNQATINRIRIYPIRLAIYTAVYGYGFYRWWMYVSS